MRERASLRLALPLQVLKHLGEQRPRRHPLFAHVGHGVGGAAAAPLQQGGIVVARAARLDLDVQPLRPQRRLGGPAGLRAHLEQAHGGVAEAGAGGAGERLGGLRLQCLQVPDLGFDAGRGLRNPPQDLLDAEGPPEELVEVHGQAPAVHEEAVVAPARGPGLQDLRRDKRQRAARLPQHLPRPADQHGKPEVRELQALVVVGQDEVRGLEVPVAYALAVQVDHRAQDLLEEPRGDVLLQRPDPREGVEELAPGADLGGHVYVLLVLEGAVHAQDVGVVQLLQQLDLREQLVAVYLGLGHGLDCMRLAGLLVVSLAHRPEGALPDTLVHVVDV
mmetsp:Transcript_54295/g.152925  ORF Transcript_54295/g.152925 Transcript_54295/m.152925 type:complete len:333 (+) Transcript_54295:434-1432(+)